MNLNLRRALGLILSAALVGGIIPPEAAHAVATIRLSVPAATTAPGASAAAGVNAAIRAGSSADFSAFVSRPSVSFGTASRSVAATNFAAPALRTTLPVAVSQSQPVDAPQTANSAAVAAPALNTTLAAAADAPSEDGAKTPQAPKVAGRGSWSARLAALVTRSASAIDPKSGAKVFDGAAEKSETAAAETPAKSGRFDGAMNRLGRWTNRKIESYKADRAIDHDDFGGPVYKKLSFTGRIGHGVKWGLNLVGISALFSFTVAPLLAKIAWPLWLSTGAMNALGRIELLAKFGPNEIGAALATSPLAFLGIALPMTTMMEEVSYRFLDFGFSFVFFALFKVFAAGINWVLDHIPDASGLRSKVQTAVRVIGNTVSYYAFTIAATKSAWAFAAAHIAHWGFSPALFLMNLIAGLVLARLAYQTHGLTSPFVAHLTFNLIMLGSAVIGVTLGMPFVAAIYGVLTTLLGLGALWYNWRSARKEKAFNAKSALTKFLVVALLATPMLGSLQSFRGEMNSAQTAAARYQLVKGTQKLDAEHADADAPVVAKDPAVVAPAAADTTKAESTADMVARVKPSVLKIIVQSGGGMAIGSGVIVTPDGLAVTNGHVVGDRKVGQTLIVELVDGTKLPAKVVAVNHDRDLAFIQLPKLVNSKDHSTVAWPTSKIATTAPREGDPVFAMGHPLNLPFTVTRGIVSGLGMRSNMYVHYMQTDASINHGNSGGPLYNEKGEVVGINTMIMGKEGSIGLGFSIIAPSVVKALAQYQAIGNINTASFGVIVDLSNPEQPDNGVAVEFVRPGSAAAKAGIRPGDVIVGAEGALLQSDGGEDSAKDLARILAQSKPGDEISVAVLRGESQLVLKVKLDAKATTEATSAAHDFDGQGE